MAADRKRGAYEGAKAIAAEWTHNGEASGLEMHAGPYQDGTGVPLLIWERAYGKAVAVTLDGRRLELADTSLVQGVPPRAQWPTAPRAICLDDDGVDALGRSAAATRRRCWR